MKSSRALLWAAASAGLMACAGGDAAESPRIELGSQKSAILHGVDAELNAEPWSVRITKAGVTSCTGTLIDPQWVLTAAHCVKGPGIGVANIAVVAGDQTRSTVDDTEQTQPAAQLIPHPSYNATTVLNDIGLIKLASPFEINAYVQTAQLATDTPSVGTYGVGWGWMDEDGTRAEYLQRGTMSVLPSTQCLDPVEASQFCASGSSTEGHVAVCLGDSGGPLLTYGRRNVVGVASHTNNFCGGTDPSVYTRVSTYRSWIIGKIGYDPRRDMRMTYSGTDASGYIYLYCDGTGESAWASTSVYGSEITIDCKDSWVWMECDVSSDADPLRTIQIHRQVGLGQTEVVEDLPTRKARWYFHKAGEKASHDCNID
jgi:hypothetical protein